MKKEFKELLNADNAALTLNHQFRLIHTRLNPETDILHRSDDILTLRMINCGTLPERDSREIKSRDFAEMQNEIVTAISEMMDAYLNEMIRKLNGGLITGKVEVTD